MLAAMLSCQLNRNHQSTRGAVAFVVIPAMSRTRRRSSRWS